MVKVLGNGYICGKLNTEFLLTQHSKSNFMLIQEMSIPPPQKVVWFEHPPLPRKKKFQFIALYFDLKFWHLRPPPGTSEIPMTLHGVGISGYFLARKLHDKNLKSVVINTNILFLSVPDMMQAALGPVQPHQQKQRPLL